MRVLSTSMPVSGPKSVLPRNKAGAGHGKVQPHGREYRAVGMGGRSDALCLVRILREPGDVSAAVDHTLADRQHDANARAGGVSHRHLTVEGGGHERWLDAAPHAKAVYLPELWGKRHAADATVDRLCLRELAELDDGAVDGVQRGRVDVQGLLGLLEGQCAVGGLEALGGALVLLGDALRAAKPHHVVFEEVALRLEPSQDLPP